MGSFGCAQVSLTELREYVEKHKPFTTPWGVVLHHTWRPKASEYKGVATIAGIWQYHTKNNGWSDIGYHFLIGPDGSIWRGRSIGLQGAHCPGRNSTDIGLCVIGDYTVEKLQEAAKRALGNVLHVFFERYGFSQRSVSLHREWRDTTCPGLLNHDTIREACDMTVADQQWILKHEGKDLPLLNIDGTTYAPVRKLTDLLGFDLEVDSAARLVQTKPREV